MSDVPLALLEQAFSGLVEASTGGMDTGYPKARDAIHALAAEVVRLQGLSKELRDMLFELQWAAQQDTGTTTWGGCPMCNKADWRGHDKDCALAALIAKVDAALSPKAAL